jgi:hypothetical protein
MLPLPHTLSCLTLDNNLLQELPHEISQLSNLRQLSLHRNQLRTLPESLCELGLLEQLRLGANQLETLPPSFGRLTRLTELYCDNNFIHHLPSSLGDLSHLAILSLSHNQLQVSSFPNTCQNLTQLKYLYLEGNQLQTFPDFLCLPSLQGLALHDNQIKFLPENFMKMTLLSELFLQNNRLTALPSRFGELRRLNWLNVTQNYLTVLPLSMIHCTDLVQFFYGDNLFHEAKVTVGYHYDVPQLLDLCLGFVRSHCGNPESIQQANIPETLKAKLQEEANKCAHCDKVIYGPGAVAYCRKLASKYLSRSLRGNRLGQRQEGGQAGVPLLTAGFCSRTCGMISLVPREMK